jgi:uncharacterized protein (TIGR03435 family)
MRLPAVLFAFILAVPVLAQSSSSATPVARMAADAHPSFAVATIKPHDPESSHQSGIYMEGDRFIIRNESVANMMTFAYSIHPRQIVNAPDSLFHDRWDIQGKPDMEGEPGGRQMQEMIQKLLADRFGLKFHRDRRELSVYAIQIAKSGPKLTPARNPDAKPDQEANGKGTEETVTYTSSTMQDFTAGEQLFLDRPLIDQTGLTGKYDFSLNYTFDQMRVTDPNAPPGMFTAIQEQLGLKLQPVKAPVDVLVIDSVQKPSEN